MPLALLLFLICAVLASIVLAAATTAGGQATTLKKSEQSYFAVTSAAKLLREQLDGQTIVITTTSTTSGGTVTPGTPVVQDERRTDTRTAANSTLLENAVDTWSPNSEGAGTEGTDSFTLEAAVSEDTGGKAAAALKVNVAESIATDGTITLTFTQAAADTAGENSYKLALTLTPDIVVSEDTTTNPGGTVTTTTTEMRITWWADELQVVKGSTSSAGGE